MNKQHILIALVFPIIGMLFSSCEKRKDRSNDINKVQTVITQLDSLENRIDAIGLEEIRYVESIIKKDLKQLELGYRQTMERKDAFRMVEYKDITKIYKKYHLKELKKEHQHTRQQLQDLSKLMSDGATLDKDGNKIDDVYIDGAIGQEMLFANKFINSIDEIESKKASFYSRYNEMKPYVDSLKNAMPKND